MESIQASVARVRWTSESSDWKICIMQSADSVQGGLFRGESFTAVGAIPVADRDETLELQGEWVDDPKYGRQFKVTTAARVLPTTLEGIEKFLVAEVAGVGPKLARKLIVHFGMTLLDVLDNNPSRLVECPGVSTTLAARISNSWQGDRIMRTLKLFLAEHGINTETWAKKISQTFGGQAIETIKNNPYKLTKVEGIGFKKADEIAMKFGWSKDTPQRIEAAFTHILTEATNEGHVFLHMGQLIDRVADLAGGEAEVNEIDPKTGSPLVVHQPIPRHEVELALERVIQRGELYEDKQTVNEATYSLEYLPRLYRAESKSAERMLELLDTQAKNAGGLVPLLVEAQQVLGIEASDRQQKAVIAAIMNPVSIITGGPGTGKSTITKLILYIMEKLDWEVKMAAPTGRAAKRLTEVTGHAASTVHKLLEFDPKEYKFRRNRAVPLDCDALILDEWSMGDIELTYNTFEAVPPNCHVVIIGDEDQLPSVGPGMVLKDLKGCGRIPVTKLDTIFRQAQGSMIVQNAHRIINGVYPNFPPKGSESDCFFMEVPRREDRKENVEWLHKMLTKLCKEHIPQKYGVDPIRDIQVLAPMKKGTAGVYELNKILQEALNPHGERFHIKGREFRRNDRVMQHRNNYDLDIFNGDIGFVEDNDEENKILRVTFDNRVVLYPWEDLDDMQHCYAATIHKSQGSEYPVTIICLLNQHFTMLDRNLIYTGLTRAKKMALFLASKSALEIAVNRCQTRERNSFLASRIKLAAAQVELAASVFGQPFELNA